MSVYEQNLAFIRDYNPAVYQALCGSNATEDSIEYLPDSSNFVIRRDDICLFMHSEYNRERELDGLCRSIQATDQTLILFGFGDGQGLESLRERFPEIRHLIIVEPNTEILRHFLHNHDFVKSFEMFYKVSLVIGKPVGAAKATLEQLVYSSNVLEKKLSLVAPIAYRTLYADYYHALEQGAVSVLRFYRVNTATKESFRTHWLINTWRNLKNVAPDVGIFRDKLTQIPAIIVAAGPSLQKNIHLLKQAKERAVIVAVGSAMTILESHGIVPHFRMAVDAAVENKLLFDKIDTSACPLIYSDHLYFDILPNYQSTTIHMLTPSSPLVNYIFDKAGLSAMSVSTGFSIANVALYLLLKLRCSHIVFMGQDLCYTDGKLHAVGAWDEDIEERYIRKNIETTDFAGNRVFTDAAFLGMKKMLESAIASYPTTRFWNATEGGLAIEGAPNIKLAELLQDELAVSQDIEEGIQQALQAEAVHLDDKAAKIDGVVDDIENDVTEILEICTKLDRCYEKVYRLVTAGINRKRINSETGRLRRLREKLTTFEYFRSIVAPVFQESSDLKFQVTEVTHPEWRKQWAAEIGLLRLEMREMLIYLVRTQDLIKEYKGQKKLNIIFE